MRAAGLRGITRTRSGPRTTRAKDETDRPADLMNRDFTATAPNQTWVADITYVRTFTGWVYAAFILDIFSRRIVGRQLSRRLYTDLALDALQMAIWTRTRDGADLSQLVHHSDRGAKAGLSGTSWVGSAWPPRLRAVGGPVGNFVCGSSAQLDGMRSP
jgi:putative transposase